MKTELTREDVANRVREVTGALRRVECRTCDCFQGYLTQLELDAGQDVSEITAPWNVDRSRMHGCLGCDPCPPGSAFAEYRKSFSKLV